MKNSEKYQKVMNQYFDTHLDNEKILQKKIQDKSHRNAIRKWMMVAASVVFILSGATLVAAAAGWIDFANIFRHGFDDSVSADLVEAGVMQELEVVNETEDFRLKLVALTGDAETPVALFELTPKVDLAEISEISLLGQTFCPCTLEDGSYINYRATEAKGYELKFDEDKKTYYFKYQLPPYWIRDLDEDLVIRISGINFYDETSVPDKMVCDMSFRFTPDRSILEQAQIIEINQLISKDVYDECSFFVNDSDYSIDNIYLHYDDIIAPTKKRTVQITNITFSNYYTMLNGLVFEEGITSQEASSVWNQFTEPRFVTNHYWDGVENKTAYELAPVDNDERIRLYVDDIEFPVDEESLQYVPDKVHGEYGNMITEGYFGCAIRFDGFNYEKAQKVEIHIGDQVIKVK